VDLQALSDKLRQGLAGLSEMINDGNSQALLGLAELAEAACGVKAEVAAIRARSHLTADDVTAAVNLALTPLSRAVHDLQTSEGRAAGALDAVARDLTQTRLTLLHEVMGI
jgi:hypothetical protein